MHLVITMAGRSKRFKDAGIMTPKWLLEVDGFPMLFWSLMPFANPINEDGSKIIFITLLEDNAVPYIVEICQRMKIRNFSIVELPISPNGQALSALEAMPFLENSQRFAIWNIDTLLTISDFQFPSDENWITLSQFEGDYWSFANVIKGEITDVAEKRRISEWTSIGLYGFKDKQTFEGLVSNSLRSPENLNSEIYVAPLYAQLIQKGIRVSPHYMHKDLISVAGTPEQLLKLHDEGRHKFNNTTVLKLRKFMKGKTHY